MKAILTGVAFAGALFVGALGTAAQAATFTITGGEAYTLPVVGGWKAFDPDPAAPIGWLLDGKHYRSRQPRSAAAVAPTQNP